ncbi:MAG: DUF6048 family protein [Chitinophagaceae bacterium]
MIIRSKICFSLFKGNWLKGFAIKAFGSMMLLCLPGIMKAQSDSTSTKKKVEVQYFGHQLRFSFDLSRPVLNQIQSTEKSYEAAVDYYYKNELYFVAEAGVGSANYDYSNLSYKTNSSFFRLGFDKTLLKRDGAKDWDMVFMGMRYGLASIQRQEAQYAIVDSVWGSSVGIVPAKNFLAHWIEITGGVKVEVYKKLMVGWNVRARFLVNGRSFQDLSPVYIAGFGRGDKTTVFDFNFYVAYALRWGNKAHEKSHQ